MKLSHSLKVLTCALLLPLFALSQQNCGDPAALNYNPVNPEFGHQCTYPPTAINPAPACTLQTVPETSGLIYWNNAVYTHNDSGGEPEIYRIDLKTGESTQVIRLIGLGSSDIQDWEDITQSETHIFIGDFGNNNGTRKDLRIYKISKSDIYEADTAWVPYEIISFYYPDQTDFNSSQSHNFDCEGFIYKDDSLYLFSKNRGDLNSKLYQIPSSQQDSSFAAKQLGIFAVNGQITGASFNAEAGVVALIGYYNLSAPFVYLVNP